jgi:small subunit ribosomal protein S17
MTSVEKSRKKVLQGIVISDRMDKTVKVLVERMVKDPKYKKYQKRRRKIMAHDESNKCHTGDLVEIIECRPLSRHKHFEVSRILKSGQILVGEEAVAENDSK